MTAARAWRFDDVGLLLDADKSASMHTIRSVIKRRCTRLAFAAPGCDIQGRHDAGVGRVGIYFDYLRRQEYQPARTPCAYHVASPAINSDEALRDDFCRVLRYIATAFHRFIDNTRVLSCR